MIMMILWELELAVPIIRVMEAARISETPVTFYLPHDATTLKTTIIIIAAVRTRNPTYYINLVKMDSGIANLKLEDQYFYFYPKFCRMLFRPFLTKSNLVLSSEFLTEKGS